MKIDPVNMSSQRYLLGIDMAGSSLSADTACFSGSLRAFLEGRGSDSSSTIHLLASGVRIQSNMMDDAQKHDLEQQLEKCSLSYTPSKGEASGSEELQVPSTGIDGWDLYRNFSKVFPQFPEIPLKVGDSWEREISFPVETRYGDATGHMYQNYSLDSVKLIDPQHQLAYVSWLYSYQIEPSAGDDSAILSMVPRGGTGSAGAVFNLSSGVVESAHAGFEVKADTTRSPAVQWHQTVHLEVVR